MPTAAVIGAGSLGGALAHTLAARERFRLIRLIDPADDVASGKALDIQQSGPVLGFSTKLVGARHVRDAIGADVIILADAARAAGPALDGEHALALIRSLVAHTHHTPIVCADATHAPLVERATVELNLSTACVIGSAPTALAAAVRAVVALELDVSPTDIALSIIGRPPDRLFVPWSQATIAGTPIEARLSAPRLLSVGERLRHLWPPGPYALASAAARVVEAVTLGSRRTYSCVVMMSGAYGVRDRAGALAVQLGPAGRVRIASLALTQQECVKLGNAFERDR